MADICLHCKDLIHEDPDHGWVHTHGGSRFAQRCEKCRKLTTEHGTPAVCPHCGAKAVFHLDHVAELAPAKASESAGRVGRGETGHAAAIVKALSGKVIQPDERALKHLAPRPRRVPQWLG